MTRRLPLFGWLVLVWIGLFGRVSAGVLVGGVLAATVVVAVAPVQGAPVHRRRLRPVPAARFVGRVLAGVVRSNLTVAREAVTPRSRIHQGFIDVPMAGVSDDVVALVGWAVTLQPGTVLVEVEYDPTVLHLHALHLHDVEAVRREVRELEELAVRAFGDPSRLPPALPSSAGGEGAAS
ncbi:hypothetical protein BH24ACT13_BH24ACT13_00650 [soil metagenome]|jgi:multicomponent Na+:H+ antiporter subunit E